MEFTELHILKEEILVFVNYQQELINRTMDISEKYNRIILHNIGRNLFFCFGNKCVNNLKSHGKTHCTFSVSIAEAAFLQFVCSFPTLRNDYQKFVMDKVSSLVDEKINNIIF